ncbi:MAG TPA: hypothetical protein DCE71_08805 [Parachlamydiales bacterium]|nr:hypothetical protein [Parachlamydiales bacterium]
MSSSSSSSQSLVSYCPSQANPIPLMENLFFTTKESDAAIQQEVLKTSQAVSRFIEQTTEQFQMMAHRIAELESTIVIAKEQSKEAQKMHEAQMRAIEMLIATVKTSNEELGALKSELSSMKAEIEILKTRQSQHTHSVTLYAGSYDPGARHILFAQNPGTYGVSYNTGTPQ